MGRKRRNQRDAIRKQRAKRRKRNSKGSSDEDDCDESEFVASAAIAPTPNSDSIPSIQSTTDEEVASVNPEKDHKPSPTSLSSKTHPAKVHSELSPATESKKPADKIERMRLKKQQQKARRKEKRALREAAAAITSSSASKK